VASAGGERLAQLPIARAGVAISELCRCSLVLQTPRLSAIHGEIRMAGYPVAGAGRTPKPLLSREPALGVRRAAPAPVQRGRRCRRVRPSRSSNAVFQTLAPVGDCIALVGVIDPGQIRVATPRSRTAGRVPGTTMPCPSAREAAGW